MVQCRANVMPSLAPKAKLLTLNRPLYDAFLLFSLVFADLFAPAALN